MMNSVAALFVLYHFVVEITHYLTTPSPQKENGRSWQLNYRGCQECCRHGY
jgi:hypothetical protein